MGATGWAALLAAFAAATFVAGPPAGRLRAVLAAGGSTAARRPVRQLLAGVVLAREHTGNIGSGRVRRRRVSGAAAAGSLVGGGAVTVFALGTRAVLPVLLLLIGAVAAGWWRRNRRVRAATAATRRSVVEACEVLSGELRAGRSPVEALARAARGCPVLHPAAVTGRLGGDVPRALAAAAAGGGAEALRHLAAAWAVAEGSGSGLGAVIDRLVDGLAAEQAIRREIAAQLAAPRATARLLAGLPILGMLLGTGLGVDPLGVLTGTPYGIACLLGGGLLTLAGVVWVDRLARSVQPP